MINDKACPLFISYYVMTCIGTYSYIGTNSVIDYMNQNFELIKCYLKNHYHTYNNLIKVLIFGISRKQFNCYDKKCRKCISSKNNCS